MLNEKDALIQKRTDKRKETLVLDFCILREKNNGI